MPWWSFPVLWWGSRWDHLGICIIILDFTGARDDEVAVASAGPFANHLHLAPDRSTRQYLTTQFLQARCPSCCPTDSIKALKAVHLEENINQS